MSSRRREKGSQQEFGVRLAFGEAPGIDFGASGDRFWTLQGSILGRCWSYFRGCLGRCAALFAACFPLLLLVLGVGALSGGASFGDMEHRERQRRSFPFS